MPTVHFEQLDGTSQTVEARAGESLMEAAVDNDVPGIIAECGGACSCATCHVYVDSEWVGKLPAPDALEDGMLDCVVERRPESRLSCQIRVDDSLAGLRVLVPAEQL